MTYHILADIASDLPKSYAQQYDQLQLLPMPYRMGGVELEYKTGDEENIQDFYRRLREGEQSTTAQITVLTYFNAFKELAEKGEGLLCMVLSSAISGSFSSAVLARNMVLEQHPDAQILLLDSLCASLGYGLLVDLALKNRAAGMSLEDNANWLEENKQRVNHWFTVDDLDFLFRGGRVTRSAALFGGMLRIKPVLKVDEQGKLVPSEKMQGRKRSLKALADKAIALSNPREGQSYFISHGDCEEDALFVKELIQHGLPGAKDFFIAPIGAVVGSHSGPGTLAVFFLADHR